MAWDRLGIVYKAPLDGSWRDNSALTPTPLVLNDRIRIFCGFRDPAGVSRLGYVDLSSRNPTQVLGQSSEPSLDIGSAGMFDDNGIILGDVLLIGNTLRCYYVGFQLVNNVKFLAYSGLATSADFGESFTRFQEIPVIDRMPGSAFINAIHSVLFDHDRFRFWLGAGSAWKYIDDKPFPSYTVKESSSSDGFANFQAGRQCLDFRNETEYRIGRPRVYRAKGGLIMLFTYGDTAGNYLIGSAYSSDGVNWERDDTLVDFHPTGSLKDWDGQQVCYGSLFFCNDELYMVYNGGSMGQLGFGLARARPDNPLLRLLIAG
jgi:hypothetical protein